MKRLYLMKTIIAMAFLMLFGIANTYSQNVWDGEKSSDWGDTTNWVGDSLPAQWEAITIDKVEGGFDPIMEASGVTGNQIGALVLAEGNTITLQNLLLPNDPIVMGKTSEIIIDSGVINIRENAPSAIDNGTITLKSHRDGYTWAEFDHKDALVFATNADDVFTFNCWGGQANLNKISIGAGTVTINFKVGGSATFSDSLMVDSLLTNGTITKAIDADLEITGTKTALTITAVTACYIPAYTELTNLVPDPTCSDRAAFNGWGLVEAISGDEAYCGGTSLLIRSLVSGNCEYPSGDGALDVASFTYKANTKYRLKVMVKTYGGSIGFLANWSGTNFGFAVDTKREWKLVDTTFITPATGVGTNFFSFNTCDFGSTCDSAFIDNYEFYEVPVSVGYFTLDKNAKMDASATTVENDPIIQMLDADPKIDLTVNVTTSSDVVDLSPYDVVIIQESYGSGDAILKVGGSLNIATIDKPFIINKSYTFVAGKALPAGSTTGSGKEQEGDGYVWLKVNETGKANDIFNGITFDSDSIPMFKTVANDAGVTVSPDRLKALNYVQSVDISNEASLLAVPCKVIPGQEDLVTMCVNEMSAGDSIATVKLQADMISFGANFGAICGAEGNNMTSEHITMWRNAVYKLGGYTVPEDLIEVGPFTEDFDIIYLTDGSRGNETPVIDWLGAQGFNVTVSDWNCDFSTLTTAAAHDSVAKINTFDLAIFGRSPSSDVVRATNGKPWLNDSILVPLVDLSAYHLRSNKIGWMNSTSAASITTGDITYAMVDGTDPLLSNIDVDGDTMITWTYPPDAEIAVTKINDSIVDAKVVAAVDGYLSLVLWEDIDSAYFKGSTDTVRSVRVGMPLGYDGTDIAWNNYLCLTDQGQQLFYNVLCHIFGITLNDVVVFSNDASLSDLTVDGTTITGFDAATLTYSIESAADVTIGATASDASSTVTGTGTVSPGSSASIVVVAQTGKKVTYKVTVTAVGSSDLSGITVDGGTLNETFAAATTSYTVTPSQASVTVTGTPVEAGATVAYAPSQTVDVSAAAATVTITVTGTSVAAKDYTVEVAKYITGINNVAENSIEIYPIPATNSLFVTHAINAEISVYQMNGALVSSLTAASDNQEIDVVDLAKGMYILQIRNEDEVSTFRFVKE